MAVPYLLSRICYHLYIYSRYGHGINCEKGIGVGPKGEVYVSLMYSWTKYLVVGFDSDGKPMQGAYLKGIFDKGSNYKNGQDINLNSAIIGPIPSENGGVRVDMHGNIYVGMKVQKLEFAVPTNFKDEPAYKCVGSVLRFDKKGGAILGCVDAVSQQPDAPRIALTSKLVAENATEIYESLAPFSGSFASTSDCCVCRVPRFDLDRYGRLYLPNAITNSVRIVDNNNNLILEFGKYGNFDSQYINLNTENGKAGKPTVAFPKIPLGWPTGAGASDKHVYVIDAYNERVVRADFVWKQEVILSAN